MIAIVTHKRKLNTFFKKNTQKINTLFKKNTQKLTVLRNLSKYEILTI